MVIETDKLSPRMRQQLLQFQQLQQQGQMIIQQRIQMELQLKETEKTLEEVSKLGKSSEIYKNIGALLIKSEKTSVSEELEERKETLELRIKTLKKQEERIQQKLKEMQAKIQEDLKSEYEGTGSAG
ncbi:MAG: prefoldin subunit beta [Candidatus Hydrothermarchaeales archaeon]